MENMNELNLNELEQVTGGGNEGGYAKKPREKAGCFIYKIASGDTLGKIARRNGTSVSRIMSVNPEIRNQNFIVAGHYIYIPD